MSINLGKNKIKKIAQPSIKRNYISFSNHNTLKLFYSDLPVPEFAVAPVLATPRSPAQHGPATAPSRSIHMKV